MDQGCLMPPAPAPECCEPIVLWNNVPLSGQGNASDPIDIDFGQLTPEQAQALLAAITGDPVAMSALNEAVRHPVSLTLNPISRRLTLTFSDASFLSADLTMLVGGGVSPDAGNVLTADDEGLPFLATTAFATSAEVTARIATVVGGASAALDTLKEIGDRIEEDGNVAAAITLAISNESSNRAAADLLLTPRSRSIATSPQLSGGGNLTQDRTLDLAPSGVVPGSFGSTSASAFFSVDQYGRLTSAGSESIQIGVAAVTGLQAALDAKAALNSPDLTGNPTAPTPPTSDDSTRLATTAFVKASQAAATAGVATFNTRTGAVTLTGGDVTGALGFSPAGVGHTHQSSQISDSTPAGRGLLIAANPAAQRVLLELGAIAEKSSLMATDIANSTAAGRGLLTAVSAAAQRSLLELGAIAQKASLTATDIADSTAAGRGLLTASNATAQRLLLELGAIALKQSLLATDISNSTTVGRSLMTAADAAAARTAIGAQAAGTLVNSVVVNSLGSGTKVTSISASINGAGQLSINYVLAEDIGGSGGGA
jgi:hypothetical protein